MRVWAFIVFPLINYSKCVKWPNEYFHFTFTFHLFQRQWKKYYTKPNGTEYNRPIKIKCSNNGITAGSAQTAKYSMAIGIRWREKCEQTILLYWAMDATRPHHNRHKSVILIIQTVVIRIYGSRPWFVQLILIQSVSFGFSSNCCDSICCFLLFAERFQFCFICSQT